MLISPNKNLSTTKQTKEIYYSIFFNRANLLLNKIFKIKTTENFNPIIERLKKITKSSDISISDLF